MFFKLVTLITIFLIINCSEYFDVIVSGEIKSDGVNDSIYVKYEISENKYSELQIVNIDGQNKFTIKYRNLNRPYRSMEFFDRGKSIALYKLRPDRENGWVLVDNFNNSYKIDFTRSHKEKIVIIPGLILNASL